MSFRKLLRLVFSMVILSCNSAWVDVVYLENGNMLEGIITKDAENHIELDVGEGTVVFNKKEITSIEKKYFKFEKPAPTTVRTQKKENKPLSFEPLKKWPPFVPKSVYKSGQIEQYLEYGNEKIQLDIYNPLATSCPVVILIHGANGIQGERAQRYKKFANDLMRKGMIAINVHYFDTKSRDWTKAIIETIKYIEIIGNANKRRIGLVGYSLGGTLALQVASIDNRVKLLAVNAGFLPAGFDKERASRLPVILMISGSEDSAMETLTTIQRWRKEMGKAIYTKVDEGIGHDNVPMNIFEEDWNAVVKFLDNNL